MSASTGSSLEYRIKHVCVCRLYQVQKRRDAKAETMRWLQDHPVDTQTGVPLFTPQTGRAPAFRGSHTHQTIGDHLYNLR